MSNQPIYDFPKKKKQTNKKKKKNIIPNERGKAAIITKFEAW